MDSIPSGAGPRKCGAGNRFLAAACLLAMVGLVLAGGSACAPRGHLALARRALAERRYADAVAEFEAALRAEPLPQIQAELDAARVLLSSEEAFAAGEEAFDYGEYASAEEWYGLVGPSSPRYHDAQKRLAETRERLAVETLIRDWPPEVVTDWGKATFSLAEEGKGLVEITLTGERKSDGSFVARLRYAPPGGRVAAFPEQLSLRAGQPFPACMLAGGRVVVGGKALWKPPEPPSVILEPMPGPVLAWAVDPSRSWLALGMLIADAPGDGEEIEILVVNLDLGSVSHVTSYRTDSSGAERRPGEQVALAWSGDGTLCCTNLQESTGGREYWRPDGPVLQDVDFAYSPDGQLLAFGRNGNHEGSLCLRGQDAGGTIECPFSVADRAVFNPVWSPDGRWLAFAVVGAEDASGARSGTLHVLPAMGQAYDTGVPVLVMRYDWLDEVIQWSPDGRYLLTSPASTHLWDTATRSSLGVSEPGQKAQFASFSPLGDAVAFKEYADGREVTWVYHIGFGQALVVFSVPVGSSGEGFAAAPVWVDEGTLVLVERRGSRAALIKLDLRSRATDEIAFPAGRAMISPDRRLLAFRTELQDGAEGVAVYDLAEDAQVGTFRVSAAGMRWSPDGTKLFLWSLSAAAVLEVRTGQVAVLSLNLPAGSDLGKNPAWSPDSGQVVLDVGSEGHRTMLVLDVPGQL